ncbi:methyltransferase domain-containing protein [Marinicella sp. W31]|uniref:class I SAM-dependent methyltransferase n=1 Tax=Marinicella sp. W31 TaxID=3023713 RepID=UPI0037567750
MSESQTLEFTGERFTPECQREIWYEHMHRYAMLEPVIKGKTVLDAACGEGYGSHMLSQWADSVVGVDIDEQAITHAHKRYQIDNLEFKQSDVLQLPFADDHFDVVVSFETLEHLAEHEALLTEFKRVLKSDGCLIISTPDKAEYSDKTGFDNAYHVKELYQHEFKDLLDQFFPEQQWFGQKLAFFSSLWQLQKQPQTVTLKTYAEEALADGQDVNYSPMYYVVVASQQKLPALFSDLHLFTDVDETVYAHYNEMIREYISVAEKFVALNDKHEAWKKHPIWGRIIRWLEKK